MRKSFLGVSLVVCLAGVLTLGLIQRLASQREGKTAPVSSKSSYLQVNRASSIPEVEVTSSVTRRYAMLPLTFEPNVGQSNAQANFVAHGNGYALFLTPTEPVLVLRRPSKSNKLTGSATGPSSALPTGRQASGVLRMQLVGANPSARFAPLDELPGKSN